MPDADLFKRGMRRLAAGVSIITTMGTDGPQGFAATSVTSVSADPTPVLLICVNRKVSCHDHILRSGIFCVNVLGEEDVEIAQAFSSPEFRERRFQICEWQTLTSGAPALSNALTSFDCELVHSVEMGSHSICFGRVLDMRLRDHHVHPLVYVDGRFDGLRSNPTIAA
jgi:flavin reductase